MVIESTCSTLNNFFKADLLPNTSHLHDGVILLLRPESFCVQRWFGLAFKQMKRQCSAIHVFLVYIFLNFVIPARSKAPFCTRKQNPRGSGRKMTSSCKWPFSSYLLASSLLNPSLYFNRGGLRIL